MSKEPPDTGSAPRVMARGLQRRPSAVGGRDRAFESFDEPVDRDQASALGLKDFDRAWSDAGRLHPADRKGRASLQHLRCQSERAAERLVFQQDGRRQTLQVFATAVLVEASRDVPETQVNCALAWASESVPEVVVSNSDGDARWAATPIFLRYRDLIDVPLTAVHEALVAALPEASCSLALRGMPFRARPAVARCVATYLRFLVGVTLNRALGRGRDCSPWGGPFEEVVKAALVARLGADVELRSLHHASLYSSAYEGLRQYQAAALRRIASATRDRRATSALLDTRNPDGSRLCRLILKRGRAILAARTLEVPWDEGPEEFLFRIEDRLRSHGVVNLTVVEGDSVVKTPPAGILAVPL